MWQNKFKLQIKLKHIIQDNNATGSNATLPSKLLIHDTFIVLRPSVFCTVDDVVFTVHGRKCHINNRIIQKQVWTVFITLLETGTKNFLEIMHRQAQEYPKYFRINCIFVWWPSTFILQNLAFIIETVSIYS